MQQQKVALYNGPVVTTNGLYRIRDITPEDAVKLVERCGYDSAIGHQAAADLLTEILGVPVELKRVQFLQRVGQHAISLKLKERPDEGTVLSVEEMKEIGYELKLITRLE